MIVNYFCPSYWYTSTAVLEHHIDFSISNLVKTYPTMITCYSFVLCPYQIFICFYQNCQESMYICTHSHNYISRTLILMILELQFILHICLPFTNLEEDTIIFEILTCGSDLVEVCMRNESAYSPTTSHDPISYSTMLLWNTIPI